MGKISNKNLIAGLVGVVSILWSFGVAFVMILINLNPFEGSEVPIWFVAIITPLLIVGLLNLLFVYRWIGYLLMLSWIILLLQGNQEFNFYIFVGWPTAIFYEVGYQKLLSRKDLEISKVGNNTDNVNS